MTPDVTLETIELRFPSRIAAVNEAAAAVAEFMNRLGIGEDVAFGVDMAVREAVTNAVIHGNKLDDAKEVGIELSNTQDVFQIIVHDQGPGVCGSQLFELQKLRKVEGLTCGRIACQEGCRRKTR